MNIPGLSYLFVGKEDEGNKSDHGDTSERDKTFFIIVLAFGR